MLEQMSEDFRASFLLRLTREIIENTETYKKLKIKEEAKEFIKEEREGGTPSLLSHDKEVIEEVKKEEIKELISEKIKKDSEKIFEMGKEDLLSELKMISKPSHRLIKKMPLRRTPPVLRIQEPTLPETVRYLKPIPTSEEIDLGKINIIVRDPLVKFMECSGPEENIFVTGIMGRKPTPIKLSKEEIEEMVGKFAAASRIPVNEGLFKAAVGNLVISAVISEIAGIKFIIRKISAEI